MLTSLQQYINVIHYFKMLTTNKRSWKMYENFQYRSDIYACSMLRICCCVYVLILHGMTWYLCMMQAKLCQLFGPWEDKKDSLKICVPKKFAVTINIPEVLSFSWFTFLDVVLYWSIIQIDQLILYLLYIFIKIID